MQEKSQAGFAERLYAAGFHDLIPVIPPGAQLTPSSKIPATGLGKTPGVRLANNLWCGANWRVLVASEEGVRTWGQWGANVGLRATNFPGVDIDCTDPQLAQMIHEAVIGQLGPAPVRTGKAPKRLLMYRLDGEPFSRMRLIIKLKDGVSHLVEILGEGQQYLVHGTHPSGAVYSWDVDPCTWPSSLITQASATACLNYIEELVNLLGIGEVKRVGDGRVSSGVPAEDQVSLHAPSIDALRECVSFIPNNDLTAPGRDEYIKVGYAIRAAAGEQGVDEGYEIFAAWAGSHEADGRVSGNPETWLSDWRRMEPPFSVGWSFLAQMARPYGYNDAAEEFEVVEGATPPAPDVRAEEDARCAATGSEAERIAALHGNAERAIFLAPRDLTGVALLEHYDHLQEAATRRDPVQDLFRGVGMSAAHKFRSYASEPKTFEVFVNAECAQNASYSALSANDARLLLRAAWSLVAPGSSLVGKGSAVVGAPRQPGKFEKPPQQWLVDKLMPRRGVGAVIGESSSGKSHVIADLSSRIASAPPPNPLTGEDDKARRFAGREIYGNASVIYFGSEAVDGWLERAERQINHVTDRPAAEQSHGVFAVDGVPPLSSPTVAFTVMRDAIQRIRASGAPAPSLIVIDVLRAAAAGNENDSGDMDLALSTAHMLARAFDTFVLLVHHTKKGDNTARGSGAIKANLDFEALVEKTGPACRQTYRLTVTKNKNGVEGYTFAWHIPALDAPFVEGAASPAGLPEGAIKISEQCAIAAGHAIRAIATGTHTVTKTELNAELRAYRPELFTHEGKAARSRQSRALQDALTAGWIEEHRGQYRAGKTAPPPETPDDLGDLGVAAA